MATIEFVLMFPIVMYLFFSAVEVGIYLARASMLDRALDLHVRSLRLGTLDPATRDELKRRICDSALIFPNCEASMTIELTPVPKTNWALPAAAATCVDRNEELEPAVEFTPGQENEIMLVRACAVLDPFFAATPYALEMPLDSSGGYVVTSASVFVNEP